MKKYLFSFCVAIITLLNITQGLGQSQSQQELIATFRESQATVTRIISKLDGSQSCQNLTKFLREFLELLRCLEEKTETLSLTLSCDEPQNKLAEIASQHEAEIKACLRQLTYSDRLALEKAGIGKANEEEGSDKDIKKENNNISPESNISNKKINTKTNIELAKKNSENSTTITYTGDLNTSSYSSKNNNYNTSSESLVKKYTAIRKEQGEKRRELYSDYIKSLEPSFQSKGECLFQPILNQTIPLNQNFTDEKCKFSIESLMPWSVPTIVPGTKIEFQYSLLFYCKIPAITLGDQIRNVADDYGFVRITNHESVAVSGKIEFEYLNQDGTLQKSQERFFLEPGEKAEDMGMWYLACKFKNIRLTELSCKK